ncbi:MAG: ribosomal protein S18-alanine N-acetyltransferase [Lachnospiraceae bacterium]|nr:ribosomal protein S18-alanine N-acetyltransferase [Lachnospiraceae bacterium]
MTIREMTFEDLDQVMIIERENFSVPWTEEGFFTYLLRMDALFLVAEEADRVLGYCGVIMAADEGDITNVSVKKDCQGRGIGSALVTELIQRTGQAGINTLFLEVRAGNRTALSLYEKMGFEHMGIRKGYYTNPTEDAVTMNRKYSR